MLRVTGGAWRGRRLVTPKGRDTRPTADRVREALFSILAGVIDLEDATVLDLFAGSGALGIEALSRGAGAAVFVEAHARTAAVLRRNLAELAVPEARWRVVVKRAEGWLRGASEAAGNAPATLVLADPPYDYGPRGQYEALLRALAESAAVAPGAWIVLETRAGEALPLPAQLESERVKRYGDTQLCLLSRRAAALANPS